MNDREWVELRVLVVNTHVGMLLMSAVRYFLRSFNPHVVLLQEVQSPTARAKLRLVFALTKWSLTGTRPPSTGHGSNGSIVALRRDRLKRTSHVSRLVTRYRDRFHPERRLVFADATDRVTAHELRISSVHTWAGANLPEHRTQVAVYGRAVQEAHAQLKLALFGGDVNERTHAGETLFDNTMSERHMIAARIEGLDGLWVSRAADVRCVQSTAVAMTKWRGGEKHHRALLVTLQLRKLTSSVVDSDR